MRGSRTLRGLAPVVAAAALAVAAITGASAAQAAPAKVTTLPKDAAVSSTGAVLTPAAAAASLAGKAGTGSRSYAGTAPTKGAPGKVAPGTISPKSVIGTDNRYQINPTTYFPARAVGVITNNGYQWCTGWLINANTILTAGHCVYSGGSNGTWYTNLRFYPGYNASSSTAAPYGSCGARQVYTLSGWYNSGDTNYDAGIVKLDCTVGNTVGWFGMWWQSASLNGLTSIIYGYPGDHPYQQWGSVDYVRSSTDTLIYYQNDTAGGDSGSPVWQYRSNASYCNGYCAMGIHTNGVDGSGNNHGTRITSGNYASFQSIAAQS